MQGRVVGGRPTYKGGRNDDWWVWYYADHGTWMVGNASSVGTGGGHVGIKDSAATPDAVQGTWKVSTGYKRNSSVTVTQIAGSTAHYFLAIAPLTSGAAWQAGAAFESRACPRTTILQRSSATTRSSRGRKGAGRRTREGRAAVWWCGTLRVRENGWLGKQALSARTAFPCSQLLLLPPPQTQCRCI
jgi:hypothetical protein